MQKIANRKCELVAIKIDSMAEGSTPITEPGDAIQVLALKHRRGKLVQPHAHLPQERVTRGLQECLTVVRGKVKVSFLDEQGMVFASCEVGERETCIILQGFHSVEFLEDSEVIESKNGPFFDDRVNLTPRT